MITKVLFHIYSLQKGGAERVVCTLAGEMARQGLSVVIATLVQGEVEYPLPRGVRRVLCGLSDQEEKKGRLRRMRTRLTRLRECLREEEPDVVFSFMQSANYRALLAAGPLHIPVIFSVRSDPARDYASRTQRLISSYLYKRAAGGVFQTQQAMDFFGSKVAERSVLIRNPLDEKYMNFPAPKERRKAIVSVGRHHYAKDYMNLVKAFELFCQKHDAYTLEIYGGDSLDNSRLQLLEYLDAHGMADRVKLMGDHSDVAECIYDAALYVLSSRYEGMPNALMEAMALGLPVLATDCPCGGPAALIEDGENGLLAEVNNPVELATGMQKMIDHPKEAERLAQAAREIRTSANAERIAGEWLAYAKQRGAGR